MGAFAGGVALANLTGLASATSLDRLRGVTKLLVLRVAKYSDLDLKGLFSSDSIQARLSLILRHRLIEAGLPIPLVLRQEYREPPEGIDLSQVTFVDVVFNYRRWTHRLLPNALILAAAGIEIRKDTEVRCMTDTPLEMFVTAEAAEFFENDSVGAATNVLERSLITLLVRDK